MFQAHLRPALQDGSKAPLFFHSLQVVGIREAELGERLAEFMVEGREPRVGVTASGGQITVRVAGFDPAAVEKTVAALRGLLAQELAYEGEHSLAEELVRTLRERGISMTVAASRMPSLSSGCKETPVQRLRTSRRSSAPKASPVKMANSAAGTAPCRISSTSSSDNPTTIGSPNPPAPINAARVAVPMLITAAVRIPANIAGRDIGRRT